MSGGQIAALIFALLLLLPGGCFLIVGVVSISDRYIGDVAPVMIVVGIVILSVMVLLFWVAFRRRPPAADVPPPDAPDAAA